MIEKTPQGWVLSRPEGQLLVPDQDDITPRLAMLYEAHCEGQKVSLTVEKFGYTKQRYYQLLHLFLEQGALALQNQNADRRQTTVAPTRTFDRSSVIVPTCRDWSDGAVALGLASNPDWFCKWSTKRLCV